MVGDPRLVTGRPRREGERRSSVETFRRLESLFEIFKERRRGLRIGPVGGEEDDDESDRLYKEGNGPGCPGSRDRSGSGRTPGHSLHEPERLCSIICFAKPESK